MVIYNRDLGRAFIRPPEDKAPLVVNPDGVKSGMVALEGFEPVAGRNGKILEHAGPVHLKKFPLGDAGNRRKTPVLFLVEKLLGVAVGEGLDHERGGMQRTMESARLTP